MTPIGRLATRLLLTCALVAAAGPAVDATTPRIKLKPILDGYERPVLVTHAGDSSRVIFIVEQTGKIQRATYRDGSWRRLGTFLDLTHKVNDPNQPEMSEQGLLGLAFHPQYATNGLFYVNYTRQALGENDSETVIAEFRRATRAKARPRSGRNVLVIDQETGFHNGGDLAFGPDEMLYISVGDAGGQGDPFENAHDLGKLHGKVLRINPRDPDGGGPKRYSVPRHNPFVGKPGRDEIWASGLRNPWRLSFDRANGNLWIGDVGQNHREEVDKARANASGRGAGRGKDFGWDDCEGFFEFEADEGDADDLCSHSVLPVHDYPHGKKWCAVTGGYVYRGPIFRRWRGLYVAGDWCGGIFVLDQKGERSLSHLTDRHITSFGEDSAGRLFAAGGEHVFLVRLVGPRP